MTAKQYLGQLRRCTQHIAILEEEIERDRARLESVTIKLSEKVQSSPRDTFTEQMARIVDKQMQLEAFKEECEQLRQRIIKQILDMPNGIYSRILFERYVQGKSFRQVSKAISYDYNYTLNLHAKALQDFFVQYEEFL